MKKKKKFPSPDDFNKVAMQTLVRLATWHVFAPRCATLGDIKIYIDHYHAELRMACYVETPNVPGIFPCQISKLKDLEPYFCFVPKGEDIMAKQVFFRLDAIKEYPRWGYVYSKKDDLTRHFGTIYAKDPEDVVNSVCELSGLKENDVSFIVRPQPDLIPSC